MVFIFVQEKTFVEGNRDQKPKTMFFQRFFVAQSAPQNDDPLF